MKIIFVIIFCLKITFVFSQQMRIGVLNNLNTKSIGIKSDYGAYNLICDSSFFSSISRDSTIEVRVMNSKISIDFMGSRYTNISNIFLFPKKKSSSLSLFPNSFFKSPKYTYKDIIEIKVQDGFLKFVNVLDMDDYLFGVVEAEGGWGRHLEYYKVQSLISRTYALKNKNRHIKEGYHLCDNQHCQVYHNPSIDSSNIKEAVNYTSGEVLVDTEDNLVTTFFSANCGGQTCDPSYVWNNSVDYLSTFKDTFCYNTKQSNWIKRISKKRWSSFLSHRYGVLEEDYGDLIYNYTQIDRKAFYIHPSLGIPLRDLRKEFKLKSTFFSSRIDGNDVLLIGHGFGHGVGLCQEGAMEMADLGYTYKQIASYYYSGVRIINVLKIDYLKQENEMKLSD